MERTKKQKKAVFNKIAEIARLGARVSTTTEHGVFVWVHGHVNCIEVDVDLGGWYEDHKFEQVIKTWYSGPHADGVEQELDEAIAYLKSLLK